MLQKLEIAFCHLKLSGLSIMTKAGLNEDSLLNDTKSPVKVISIRRDFFDFATIFSYICNE